MIFLTEKMHNYMKTNVARIRDFRAIRLLVSVTMLMIVGGVVRADETEPREFNDGTFVYRVINEEDKTCEVVNFMLSALKGSDEQITVPGKVMDGDVTYNVKKIVYCPIRPSSEPSTRYYSVGKLTFSEGIEEICANSCESVDVKHVVFPRSLRTIGKNAFYDSDGLHRIDMKDSIEYIDDGAFGISRETSYKQVYINSQIPPKTHRYAFRRDYRDDLDNQLSDSYSLSALYIPRGSKERYMSTEPWNIFPKIQEKILPRLDDGKEHREFNDGAYIYRVISEDDNTCEVIGVLMDRVGKKFGIYQTIPGEVTDGGKSYQVKRIVKCGTTSLGNDKGAAGVRLCISEGIEEICDSAFIDNGEIYSVTFPSSLEYIGVKAFAFVPIYVIYFKDNIECIDTDAFANYDDNVRGRRVYVDSQVPPFADESAFDYWHYRADSKSLLKKYYTLYVPIGSSGNYKNTSPWGYIQEIHEVDLSGIEDVPDEAGANVDGLRVEVHGGEISFPGLAADERIEVYSMDGRMVYGGTNRPVSLPKGLYLARAKGIVAKVAVR